MLIWGPINGAHFRTPQWGSFRTRESAHLRTPQWGSFQDPSRGSFKDPWKCSFQDPSLGRESKPLLEGPLDPPRRVPPVPSHEGTLQYSINTDRPHDFEMRGLGSPHKRGPDGPLTGADPSFVLYSEPLIGSERPHDFEMRDPRSPHFDLFNKPLICLDRSHGVHSHEGTGPLPKSYRISNFW